MIEECETNRSIGQKKIGIHLEGIEKEKQSIRFDEDWMKRKKEKNDDYIREVM